MVHALPKFLLALVAAVLLSGCQLGQSLGLVDANGNAKPIDQAAVATNLNNVTYLLKAAGCPLAAAGALASPYVQIAGDKDGNQVLTGLNNSNAAVCSMVVPPTAVPAPVPANTPAVAIPVAAPAAAPAAKKS